MRRTVTSETRSWEQIAPLVDLFNRAETSKEKAVLLAAIQTLALDSQVRRAWDQAWCSAQFQLCSDGTAPAFVSAYGSYGVLQAFAVAGSVSRPWRAMGTYLAIREIAAQHCESGCCEGFRQRDQQGPPCV